MGLDGSWAEAEARLEDSRLWRKDHQVHQSMKQIAARIDVGVNGVWSWHWGEKHVDRDERLNY